ncbi:uncharacterized protein LOC115886711 isoform X2 [Sitophilus oryzae]|uniref:Uncharacterized protein LOC115886711 isoform X2 n=1 Tax=Sitophilus oryzae TaxID=7048 RepID=A0A6J2YES3_SITOR|nr:uncharacterized protein LOC115886711 isoform X2 [Sitophilus oryzae]
MSVCVDTSSAAVLSQPAPPAPVNVVALVEPKVEPAPPSKAALAKLVVSGQHLPPGNNQVLQKVVNSPLITVLNSAGPLTVVKSLCVTSVVSSAPHYTLVNSTPLTVTTNAGGKPPTITVLNCGPLTTPVTVVKAISAPTPSTEKTVVDGNPVVPNVQAAPLTTAVLENRGHNVFVKNTCVEPVMPEAMPQSHKLLTAANFSSANVLNNVPLSNKPTTVNGQRNKVKILSNVQIPGPSQTNVILNKNAPVGPSGSRPLPAARPKLTGNNGASAKFFAKQINNIIKSRVNSVKTLPDKSMKPTNVVAQKNVPAKPITPNSFVQKPPQTQPVSNVKTLSPQNKNVPGQVQRTGSGLRTIPPQRPQKPAVKPNYIGKHAVQAQKVKQMPYAKMKTTPRSQSTAAGPVGSYNPPPHEKQLTFNQALAAQIIETLSSTSSTPPQPSRYEIMPSRYDNAFKCPEKQQSGETSAAQAGEDQQNKSGLDALSLICQAVLLDHNYNATLPADSPRRPSQNVPPQINGLSSVGPVLPAQVRRRPPPQGAPMVSQAHANLNLSAGNSALMLGSAGSADDDAASDISDCSDRKHDTEGEETDTAPEVEDVKNDDHYGDYVTRCICGFLHDDGYMVECDRCKVWQHVQCVIKNRVIPDEYLCDMCDPSKHVDRQKARLAQQQWIRERQLLEPKIRKEAKLKDALRQKENHTDSESTDNEQPPRNNNVAAKGRTLASRKKAETQRNARRELKEAPVHRRPKRKERKIVKRKAKVPRQAPPPAPSHSDDENQDAWSAHLPQLRQWIEKYEEAVTNHYSPELRARISSIRVNGAYADPVSPQYDSSVCKCRVHTQPLTEIKYLVSTAQLAPDTPVVELRGKYMLSTQHRHAGGSLATRQHTQRPGPFLFFYKLPPKDNTEVCVDTRTYGNSARFIRRSCRPNAELRHCIEKGVLHLYVVAVTTVDKNSELTIRHESHDLAAVGTTQIACACGRPDQCAVNKTSIKRNGEVGTPAANANAAETTTRKRRGRRTASTGFSPAPLLRSSSMKESPPQATQEPAPPAISSPPPPEIKADPDAKDTKDIKVDIEEAVDVKIEIKEEPVPKIEIKIEPKVEEEDSDESPEVTEEIKPSPPSPVKTEIKKEKTVKEEKQKSPASTPIATRRSSHYKSDKEDGAKESDSKEQSAKSKKLSREERKLEAILRAIEQMEKADQKKQEHQAKQAHRRESEPGPNAKEEDKQEPKIKRRRRRGRARTTSTNAQVRRSRLNSTDSYVTSGDENLLSPNEGLPLHRPSFKDDDAGDKAADLLLALSNGDSDKQMRKSPVGDGGDSNNTSVESSPEAPQLSSACLLVQAAVEPLESGFKFPKTKKGLMNEWLNKAPESLQQSVSYVSPPATAEEASVYASNTKNLAALAQAASFCDSAPQTRGGNAKKRWLRQAISEDRSTDGASNRPDSPTISEAVAPPKKRRLPRESLSNDNSPPTTPTSSEPAKMIDTPRSSQEGGVEIVYSSAEGDSPVQAMESDTELKERAAQMKQEFGKATQASAAEPSPGTPRTPRTLLDPRLSRENSIFANSDHLVGTVEKTLSMLGFESGGIATPTKRKLSITEYRQRKKLNTDKSDEQDDQSETACVEDTNSSESFKPESMSRPRSGSSSSSTSFTSGDEMSTSEMVVKAPAFNSEPTELERQREISSLRLKKAFGLSIDDDVRKPPVLDVNAILNCDLEPVQRSSPHTLTNPGFSSTSFCESSMSPTLLKPSDIPDRTCTPPADDMDNETTEEKHEDEEVKTDEEMPLVEEESALMEESGSVEKMETSDCGKEEETLPPVNEREESSEKSSSHLFYTPDDDEDRADRAAPVAEPEEVNYVPPFNNPVYPNNNFTSFTSAIDDDSRYQSRNPSPPPDLDTPSFGGGAL